MPSALTQARHDLERVQEETRKAAGYLTVSRAIFRVPQHGHRWVRSDLSPAMEYIQKGTHMAFAVTLAAALEEGSRRNRVSVPRLLTKLSDAPFRRLIAHDRGVAESVVAAQADRAREKFDRLRRLPIYGALRALRHNVIAHHGRDLESHGATNGPLNRLMVGTLGLVDRMALALNGEPTDAIELMRHVRQRAVAFWDVGMDGYPEDHVQE